MCVSSHAPHHEATDQPIEATPQEIENIREMLAAIEKMLAGLFGNAYDRGPIALEARQAAAMIVDLHFDEVVERWANVMEQSFGESAQAASADHGQCVGPLRRPFARS